MFQKNTSSYDDQSYTEDQHQSDDVETVVGPSVHVEGDFSSEGNIVVKGSVAGTVNTSRQLRVEQGARIAANVRAQEAFVAGEIKGNVKIAGQLDLAATATILGDISCETLSMEAGALVYGKVAMKGLASSVEKTSKRKRRSKKDDVGEASSDEETSV